MARDISACFKHIRSKLQSSSSGKKLTPSVWRLVLKLKQLTGQGSPPCQENAGRAASPEQRRSFGRAGRRRARRGTCLIELERPGERKNKAALLETLSPVSQGGRWFHCSKLRYSQLFAVQTLRWHALRHDFGAVAALNVASLSLVARAVLHSGSRILRRARQRSCCAICFSKSQWKGGPSSTPFSSAWEARTVQDRRPRLL